MNFPKLRQFPFNFTPFKAERWKNEIYYKVKINFQNWSFGLQINNKVINS